MAGAPWVKEMGFTLMWSMWGKWQQSAPVTDWWKGGSPPCLRIRVYLRGPPISLSQSLSSSFRFSCTDGVFNVRKWGVLLFRASVQTEVRLLGLTTECWRIIGISSHCNTDDGTVQMVLWSWAEGQHLPSQELCLDSPTVMKRSFHMTGTGQTGRSPTPKFNFQNWESQQSCLISAVQARCAQMWK